MPKNPESRPLTYSASGAGRVLGFGKAKTLALIHSGRLKAVRLDTRIRVTQAAIDDFLASLPPLETTAA